MMQDKTFFYPNACHFCKIWKEKLMSCDGCQMIFYCSQEHQRQHWPQHQEMCAAIKFALGLKKYMNTEEISMGKWAIIRFHYLNQVTRILRRDLKTEEVEMFLYPKACVVCHRQDTLIVCNNCPSAAFCEKHRNESQHRENYCKLLRDSFLVRGYLHSTEKINTDYIDRISIKKHFYDMESFLDIYVPFNQNNEYVRMLHSDLLSNPLTIYFCIQKLDYLTCKTLSIHIIGERVLSSPQELRIWRILLILIPTLTTLTITFIEAGRVFSGCDTMTQALYEAETQTLVMNMYYMSYKRYMYTTDFKNPNFIVGFNTRILDSNFVTNKYIDMSGRSQRTLKSRPKCPYILILDQIDNNIYEREINPFTNLMGYRHIRKYISCPNKYVIIYKYLDSSKVLLNKACKCSKCLITNRE